MKEFILTIILGKFQNTFVLESLSRTIIWWPITLFIIYMSKKNQAEKEKVMWGENLICQKL